MTMKEACNYVRQEQQKRGREHRRAHSHEKCSGLTDKEYNAVITSQKSTFAKGKSYAYTARWRAFTETL